MELFGKKKVSIKSSCLFLILSGHKGKIKQKRPKAHHNTWKRGEPTGEEGTHHCSMVLTLGFALDSPWSSKIPLDTSAEFFPGNWHLPKLLYCIPGLRLILDFLCSKSGLCSWVHLYVSLGAVSALHHHQPMPFKQGEDTGHGRNGGSLPSPPIQQDPAGSPVRDILQYW